MVGESVLGGWHDMILYDMIQYDTIWHDIMQY